MEKFKIKAADFFGTLILRIMMSLDDIIDTIVTMVITLVVVLVMVNYFFMPVRVIGSSMVPTISDGAFGFSSIVSRRIGGINRFDIVVISMEDKNERLVKRVVGLPGETIWFQNDTLYVDGEPIDQDFLDMDYVSVQISKYGREYFTDDTYVYQLADNEYFCVGDNRIVSLDSRFYGPFNGESIESKGIFILLPFSCFGTAN